MPVQPRVIIVGAGPMGLVAAHAARRRNFQVTVFEQGDVGDALRRWGATRFFTPFAMNLPEWLRGTLPSPPHVDALLTGPEMVERVLLPLAAQLGERVRTHHRVRAVARARMTRQELVGHPLRGERPFRVLVDTPAGEEAFEAERVLDASGVYGQPAPLLAVGERAVADQMIRDLGTLDRRAAQLAGRRVLLVGHGHSAAHALGILDELARTHAGTHLTWAVRSANLRPCVEVAEDPLPERRAVVARANEIAGRPPAYLRVERRATIESLERSAAGLAVVLSGERRLEVDALVALTGYRPDLAILSELALEVAPKSEGGARLAHALASVTDCLSVPRVEAKDLASGEPGFHLVGAKSYGRAATFLLQTGYRQLEAVIAGL